MEALKHENHKEYLLDEYRILLIVLSLLNATTNPLVFIHRFFRKVKDISKHTFWYGTSYGQGKCFAQVFITIYKAFLKNR